MRINIISFTSRGFRLGKKLENLLASHEVTGALSREYGGVNAWVGDMFSRSDALVFVGSTGIAVRSISPYIQSKMTDPAVLVLDEEGSFVIPLLSGHVGGGNSLGEEISQLLKNTLVLTTATDVLGIFAVDSWAVSNGYTIGNPEKIVTISSALLEKKTVGITSPYSISKKLPEGIVTGEVFPQIQVSPFITDKENTLFVVPKTLTLGIGCKKDTSYKAIEALFHKVIKKHSINPKSFKGLHSIDLKKAEKGLIEFSEKYEIPFKTYTSEELGGVLGDFASSDFVKSVTGVDNVCERSAVIGGTKGIIVDKTSLNGVTMAVAEDKNVLIELE